METSFSNSLSNYLWCLKSSIQEETDCTLLRGSGVKDARKECEEPEKSAGGSEKMSSFQTLSNFRILGLMVDDDQEDNLFPINGILKILPTLEQIILGTVRFKMHSSV